MPILTILAEGSTTHVPGVGTHKRAPRGDATGWSKGAAARNTVWLQSVNRHRLHELGSGFTVTLTLRDSPPTAAAFHRLRRAWLKRVERMGLTAYHWVIENQARRVPHLHVAMFMPWSDEFVGRRQWWRDETDDLADELGIPELGSHGRNVAMHSQSIDLVEHWMDVARPFGASRRAQHVGYLYDMAGWAQYVAKHVSRGEYHYQRSPESIPAGWEKPGRVWGHGGSWPMVVPEKYVMDDAGTWAYRRLQRALLVSRASKALHDFEAAAPPHPGPDYHEAVSRLRRSVRAARRLLQFRPPWDEPPGGFTKGQLRAYSQRAGRRVWHTKAQAQVMLTHLVARGFELYQPTDSSPRALLKPIEPPAPQEPSDDDYVELAECNRLP